MTGPAFVAFRCCQGTSTAASYAGTGSTTIELPTCTNGIKDGAEPDVDCGGLCKQKCGPQKKCTKGGDCFNGMCLKGTCGGKSGTSQQEVGPTCLCATWLCNSFCLIMRDGRHVVNGVLCRMLHCGARPNTPPCIGLLVCCDLGRRVVQADCTRLPEGKERAVLGPWRGQHG